jgi:hypothetical protein
VTKEKIQERLSVKTEVQRSKDVYLWLSHPSWPIAQSRRPKQFLCRVSGPSDDPMNRTYVSATYYNKTSIPRLSVMHFSGMHRGSSIG